MNFFHDLHFFRSCFEYSQLLFIGIPDINQISVTYCFNCLFYSIICCGLLIVENVKEVTHDITIDR